MYGYVRLKYVLNCYVMYGYVRLKYVLNCYMHVWVCKTFFFPKYPFISYKTILLTVVNWEQNRVNTRLSLVSRSVIFHSFHYHPLANLQGKPFILFASLSLDLFQFCIKTLEAERSMMEVGNTTLEFH